MCIYTLKCAAIELCKIKRCRCGLNGPLPNEPYERLQWHTEIPTNLIEFNVRFRSTTNKTYATKRPDSTFSGRDKKERKNNNDHIAHYEYMLFYTRFSMARWMEELHDFCISFAQKLLRWCCARFRPFGILSGLVFFFVSRSVPHILCIDESLR